MLKFILAALLSAVVLEVHAISIGNLFGDLAGRPEYSGMSVDRALEKISERENSKLPKVIDTDMRLDKVAADPGQRFIYHYTMLNDLSVEENIAKFNNLLMPKLKNRVCSDKKLKMFFNSGVTVSYQYRTQDGHDVGKFDVSPSDCGYKT